MKITEDLKAKALVCETAEELLTLAADNGIELAPEEAGLILQSAGETPEGALADDELEGVAGGAAGCRRTAHEVVYFETEAEVEYIFNIGDIKQAFIGQVFGNETATVRITRRETRNDEEGWCDVYRYERIGGPPTLSAMYEPRNRFEK